MVTKQYERDEKMNIEELMKRIKEDPENANFTDKGYEPICMIHTQAKILIIGQAPGLKTQEKGGVFYDLSGNRLRSWLDVDEDFFYNSGLISVLPMDFYFPGHGKSGDLPPRKNFADRWHKQCLDLMPHIELTILIGKYAQDYYLENVSGRITDNVLNYKQYLPKYFPLIHPSPRNQIWISKHPIFEAEILPALKHIVKQTLEQ